MSKPAASAKSLASRERVRKHREALRARGLKPITRWLPDTTSPEFQADYRRQCEALAAHDRADTQEEAEYWRWAESLQCDEGWI